MSVTAAISARIKRDFASEWNESLRVKDRDPLGEVAIAKAMRQRS
jgi:hypothetical protein